MDQDAAIGWRRGRKKVNIALDFCATALIMFNELGTMLDMPYNQFTGTVQVMKAVGNHLVLSFCETLPNSQMFTIILTRKPHMLSRDVSCDKKTFQHMASD